MVEFSAKKQSIPYFGVKPRTDLISIIGYFL
jgi:hypothetical protein